VLISAADDGPDCQAVQELSFTTIRLFSRLSGLQIVSNELTIFFFRIIGLTFINALPSGLLFEVSQLSQSEQQAPNSPAAA
jgi:hypothetical protein